MKKILLALVAIIPLSVYPVLRLADIPETIRDQFLIKNFADYQDGFLYKKFIETLQKRIKDKNLNLGKNLEDLRWKDLFQIKDLLDEEDSEENLLTGEYANRDSSRGYYMNFLLRSILYHPLTLPSIKQILNLSPTLAPLVLHQYLKDAAQDIRPARIRFMLTDSNMNINPLDPQVVHLCLETDKQNKKASIEQLRTQHKKHPHPNIDEIIRLLEGTQNEPL